VGHTKFWLLNLKRRDHLEDVSIDGKIISEWLLGKQGGKVWTGFNWLKIGTFKSHKKWSLSNLMTISFSTRTLIHGVGLVSLQENTILVLMVMKYRCFDTIYQKQWNLTCYVV